MAELGELNETLKNLARIHSAPLPEPDPRLWDELAVRTPNRFPRRQISVGRRQQQPCLLCALPERYQEIAWYAYAKRRKIDDVVAALHAEHYTAVTHEIASDHFWDLHAVQPPAPRSLRKERSYERLKKADPRLRAIVHAVHRQRVLRADQIERLFYSKFKDEEVVMAGNNARNDLLELTTRYYLYQYNYRPEGRGTKKKVYFLNRAGAHFLEAATGETPMAVTRVEEVKPRIIEHDTSAAELFVSMRSQTTGKVFPSDGKQWQLILPTINWYAERHLSFQYENIRQHRLARIQPDGFATVGATSQSQSLCLPFFYEFDRGTRSVEDVIAQISDYISFTVTRMAMKRFPDLDVKRYHPPLLFIMRKGQKIPAVIEGVKKLTKEIPEEVRPVALITDEKTVLSGAWEPGAWTALWRTDEVVPNFTLLDALLLGSRPLKPAVLDARTVLKFKSQGGRPQLNPQQS